MATLEFINAKNIDRMIRAWNDLLIILSREEAELYLE
jgi:hypothetical protein